MNDKHDPKSGQFAASSGGGNSGEPAGMMHSPRFGSRDPGGHFGAAVAHMDSHKGRLRSGDQAEMQYVRTALNHGKDLNNGPDFRDNVLSVIKTARFHAGQVYDTPARNHANAAISIAQRHLSPDRSVRLGKNA